jgi:hypothetical protein
MRSLCIALIGGMVGVTAVYADLDSVQTFQEFPSVCIQAEGQSTVLSCPSDYPGVVAGGLWAVEHQPKANTHIRQTLDISRPLRTRTHELGIATYDLLQSAALDIDSFLPEVHTDVRLPVDVEHVQSLGSGQSSLALCMSALMGLALCSSAHSLKTLSCGFAPEWYHSGGPIQIGHSLAIAVNADGVCPVTACCFVQPVHAAEDVVPQYRTGTVVSL